MKGDEPVLTQKEIEELRDRKRRYAMNAFLEDHLKDVPELFCASCGSRLDKTERFSSKMFHEIYTEDFPDAPPIKEHDNFCRFCQDEVDLCRLGK